MITDDQEYNVALERIGWFQRQIVQLRLGESNPTNYRAAASGFLSEIDRMQREVREYLSLHPSEVSHAA